MAFNADSKMGELLDNPEARAVLVKVLPSFDPTSPMLKMARGMSLKTIASFPQANITTAKLQEIVGELEKL